MCIAIVKTKNGNISDEQLKNCFEHNPDGAGVAYSVDNELYMIKGIFDEDEFIDAVRYAESKADGAILIHCRISTSGLVDKTNCHPHVVHNNCVMIHNGVLKITVPKDSKVSDTVLFVNGVLRNLPENFMFDEGILSLIEFAIGSGNKFCFLHSNGEYAIVNEGAGEWVDGVWFSNESYEDSYVKYYGNGYYSNWYDDYDYPNYKDYRTKNDENKYCVTSTEWLELENYINSLRPDELIELGPDPIYDYQAKELVPDIILDEDEDVHDYGDYLMNVSEYLYETYEELYQTALSMYEYGNPEELIIQDDTNELVEQ